MDKKISHELVGAIEKYNLANLISVDVEGTPIMISSYNLGDEGYFTSEKEGYKFKVDHLKQSATDIGKISSSKSLYDSALDKYVSDQYTNGEYLIIDDEKILIKGGKTSNANYWTGSWRSVYDISSKKGEITIDVHYYEDGNVRLQTVQNVEINDSGDIIQSIKEIETKVQLNLNKQFQNLNEAVFKQLRRQLPVTRSKINWGKAIGNYKLGKLQE